MKRLWRLSGCVVVVTIEGISIVAAELFAA